MSEVIVRAIDLTKVYRLYAKPHYRFLDMFGMLGSKRDAYTEHRALDRINLAIRRGEKVAFIGRNGAGKSTFLKLATSVIEPTSGRIEVAEGANALLQIGAGFHPDFTGRQNAYSYLSHLDVTAAEADAKVLEIVNFAELEEYIDQPIKTYSTGMVARLMFATSTTITPRLLVLDEILGVGDAYFAQKSYERIREMCETSGTTVLLVSHDIYSASKLCERMIWIDHGRVVIDGPSATVMKAYEDSVRVQEEARLRKKKLLNLETAARGDTEEKNLQHLRVEIQSWGNEPLTAPVVLSCLALRLRNGDLIEAPLTTGAQNGPFSSRLDLEHGCWGGLELRSGLEGRVMLDHGSPFHHVAATFSGPNIARDAKAIEITCHCDRELKLQVLVFLGEQATTVHGIEMGASEWVDHVVPVGSIESGPNPAQGFSTAGRHGAGQITIENLVLLDSAGNEAFVLTHGQAATIAIDYRIRKRELRERAQVLVAILRDGVQDVCRTITRELLFDVHVNDTGRILAHFPRLPLGNGTYTVSVLIATEGYYDHPQTIFYSINPEVYACVSRGLEFCVDGGGIVGNGTVVVEEAHWSFADDLQRPDISGGASVLRPGFPQKQVADFPEEWALASAVTDRVIEVIQGADLSPLSYRSPSLRNFDWVNYLRLSAIRMAHALRQIRRYVVKDGRVLDIGAYFGNFAVMAARDGYRVDALDSYAAYQGALEPVEALMASEGITVMCDMRELRTSDTYDAVLLMGVIEHVPHTPKQLLEQINRLLKPDGVLILDTPNLGYLYNRQRLAAGRSVYCPIQYQFHTELPFEGHHREYTADEIRWMLSEMGHRILFEETFNYSIYGADVLNGIDAANFREMENDSSKREILLFVSRAEFSNA